MSSVELPSDIELKQLGAVVERLPIAVIVFDAATQQVVFANSAAHLFVHPATIRLGGSLPNPWPSFSLPGYAERLLAGGSGAERRVDVDTSRVYVVTGIPPEGTKNGAILIENVAPRQGRLRVEREFAANAAHELLTPLTGIVSAAHVLQAGAKEVPAERDRFVEHIAHEASRLSRIARSLLILARAQTGEEPPTRDVFPLRPILDEVAASFSTKVTIRCDESVTVFTDAHLFLQAATNLASNAVRYGDGAGIVIEAREAGSNVTQIDVLDGGLVGHGSGTDHRARFRTADPDSGGFGLGLSIAEQSLHAVGGHLELREGMARIELPTADWTA